MKIILPVLKALADRNRLRVLAALVECEELCACQITELLQVKGSTASKHLGILISVELITSRKDGRWVYYSLNNKSFNFKSIMKWLKVELGKSDEIGDDISTLKKISKLSPEDLCRQQRGKKCCP